MGAAELAKAREEASLAKQREEELQRAQAKLRQTEQEVAEMQTLVETTKDELRKTQQGIRGGIEASSEAKQAHEDLRRRFDFLRRQAEQKDDQIQELQHYIESSQEGSVARLRDEREREIVLQELRVTVEKLQRDIKSRDQEIGELRESADSSRKELLQSKDETVRALELEREEMEKEARRAKHELQLEQEIRAMEAKRFEEQAKELQSTVERTRTQYQSQDQAVAAIAAERDRAEAEARLALERLENERLGSRQDAERRDQELLELKETLEKAKRTYELSQADEIAALVAERDKAERDARTVRSELESELENKRFDLERREQQVNELQAMIERNQRQYQLSQSEEVASLIADREKAEAAAFLAQQALDDEVTRHRNEARAREQELLELQESVARTRRKYEQSRAEEIASLTLERDQAEKEAHSLKRRLEADLERKSIELARKEEQIKTLQETMERHQQQYQLSESEEVAALIADRMKAETDAQALRQRLHDESDQHRLELKSREKELLDLQESFDESRRKFQLAHEAEFAQLAAARDKAKADARVAHRELESKLEQSRMETAQRQAELQEVQEQAARAKQQYEQSQSEQVKTLLAERDAIKLEADAMKQKLERELENHRHDVKLRDHEVDELRKSVERARLQYQSKDEEFANLIQERNKAEEGARTIRRELELELENHRADLERREEELRQVQGDTAKLKLQYLQARKDAVAELRVEHEKTMSELKRSVLELQAELETARRSIITRDQEIADLKSAADRSKAHHRLALDEMESELASVREKYDKVRLSANQTEDELDRRRREFDRREEDVRELRASLEKTKGKLQHAQDETIAARAKAELQARTLEKERSRDQEHFRRDLKLRDDEIKELEATLSKERDASKSTKDEAVLQLTEELDTAMSELNKLKNQLAKAADNHERELESRTIAIESLESELEKLKADRSEVVKIAEEAIATQAELENRVTELEEELSDLADRSVPKEELADMEEAHAQVARDLHEAKRELSANRSELGEVKTTNAELQFTIRNVEKERDHLERREAEHKQEIERLRAQLAKAHTDSQEAHVLRRENLQLKQELEAMANDRLQQESENSNQVAEIEEQNRQLHEEIESLKEQLSASIADREMDFENELALLREQLARGNQERESLEASLNDVQGQLDEEAVARESTNLELEQTRADLASRIADVKELSSNLKQVFEEKEAAEEQVTRLKKSLATFQDDTRTRVQKVLDQRSEWKGVVAETVEENKRLVDKNRELQSALDDLRRSVTDAGDQTALTRELQKSRDENEELRRTTRQLRDSFEDLLRARTTEPPFGQTSQSLDARFAGDASKPWRPETKPTTRAEELLQKALKEKEALAAENRALQSSLYDREGRRETSQWPNTAAVLPTPALRDSESKDELIAYLALSAKKTAEQSVAEQRHLEEQLGRLKEARHEELVERLWHKVRGLESTLMRDPATLPRREMPDEETRLEQLTRRVRLLERQVEETAPRRRYLEDRYY